MVIKKADRFLLSICLSIWYLLFGSSSLSTKGKRQFYICVLVQRKIAVWVAKKPEIIGLFAGDIFFVSTLWSECRDSNSRPLEPHCFFVRIFSCRAVSCGIMEKPVISRVAGGRCAYYFAAPACSSNPVFKKNVRNVLEKACCHGFIKAPVPHRNRCLFLHLE